MYDVDGENGPNEHDARADYEAYHMNYPYETNSIDDGVREIRDSLDGEVYLTDSRLSRITRLRLVTDQGFPFWDLSYCYGVLNDGTNVRVHLPVQQFSKKNLKGDLIAMCREAKVYAKGLGLLDDSVISKLW